MDGRDEVLELLQRAIRTSSADQTEAVYLGNTTHLTRFANNYVHQNVSEQNGSLIVRVVVEGRLGSAVTNDFSPESVKRTLQTAANTALAQPPDPDFHGLAPKASAPEVPAYHLEVAEFTPMQRADGAGAICRLASDAGYRASGTYSTGEVELALANSNGSVFYQARTEVEATVVMTGDAGSGYADALSTRLEDVNPTALGEEALERARLAQNPQDIEPGTYDVVLDTYAVQDLAHFLAMLSFGARPFLEGRSFMTGRLGEEVMSSSISFWDDGNSPEGLAMPFDFEGTPKERVELVTSGTAQGVVYDRETAREAGTESTGHAMPPGATTGPMPMNLFLAAGDTSRDELIAGVERGILVTRFWYTRTVHPLSVMVTGTTRDGTYLIEGGRVTKPVKNLRFTTSYLEALRSVSGVGRDTALGRSWLGSSRVPALHLGNWTFTGVTEF